MNPLPRSPGIGESLEHHHHGTLSGHATGAGTVERRTRPVGNRALEREALKGHQVEVALAGSTQHRIAIPLAEQVRGGGDR